MCVKVSIIIPNYNHKPFLQQRLDSVFNQTFQDFEVILLDDASTDGSQDLLKSYKNHPKVTHIILNETNSGSPFKQWQKGIELAQGEYIWIAESDDYCELDFLEELLKNCSANLVYAQSQDVDADGRVFANRLNYTSCFSPNIWEESFVLNGSEFIKNFLSFKNVIPNASAVLFKKELVNHTTFNSGLVNMTMCGDWWFWIKLVEKSDIQFKAKILNYFRSHDNVSRRHLTAKRKRKRLSEEKQIRLFLLNELGVFNLEATNSMYEKWFNLTDKNKILSSNFYTIKLPNISKLTFAIKGIVHKIKSK